MASKGILIGCIGDDFTGSSDAASFLAQAGLKTVLVNGVDVDLSKTDASAVVIALKTRSAPREVAVKESLSALDTLLAAGAQHIYVKYCSTFDSTKEGNIGPVLDALMERMEVPYTVLCPALPVNGRIVRHGVLYVDGVPLAGSPKKNHPLNPMWASRIAELMEPQSQYPCMEIPHEQMAERSVDEIHDVVKAYGEGKEHFYVIPDHVDDGDGERIADLFSALPLLSGGSGILAALAARYRQGAQSDAAIADGVTGSGIVFAGSCSVATLGQIEAFKQSGGESFQLSPLGLMEEVGYLESVWDWLSERLDREVLLYSSDTPANVRTNQQHGEVSSALEKAFAALAVRAQRQGVRRFIIAGGETSGAVAQALGYHAFIIGSSVAPGVPVLAPVDDLCVRLVLKSGNFGQEDFFQRALAQTRR